MKIAGNLDIQIRCGPGDIGDGRDGVELRIHDDKAQVLLATIRLPGNNFMAAMSGLAHVECEIETSTEQLARVGKTCESKYLEVDLPDGKGKYGEERQKLARERALLLCPEGWTPSPYFGSQTSFYENKGVQYARCTIRRWV